MTSRAGRGHATGQGRAGQGKVGETHVTSRAQARSCDKQGRAGQGRAGQGRAGEQSRSPDQLEGCTMQRVGTWILHTGRHQSGHKLACHYLRLSLKLAACNQLCQDGCCSWQMPTPCCLHTHTHTDTCLGCRLQAYTLVDINAAFLASTHSLLPAQIYMFRFQSAILNPCTCQPSPRGLLPLVGAHRFWCL